MVNVIINGKQYKAKENATILEVAKENNINIPTLCYLKEINEIGACRVCVVEVKGFDRLVPACETLVKDSMEIITDSKKVVDARRNNLKLILSEHNTACTSCVRSGNCTLQSLANEYNITDIGFDVNLKNYKWDNTFPLIRDNNKCIKCMRCINVCDKIQSLGVWDTVNTGARTIVDVKRVNIREANCSLCGQCITHCPTGALTARDDTYKVISALNDNEKITVVQVAPAVRTSWGEMFNLKSDFANENRLVDALKQIGFNYVFDTDFSADLTIMEEGTEFLARLGEIRESKLPMFTSCCPGWVRFIKSEYPQLVSRLSSAKSPQQMFGAITKSYYAELLGVDKSKIFSVSIMPCVAKKDECAMEKMKNDGIPDVDVSLTVRELDRLIKEKGINVNNLKEKEFDKPLGVATGAGVIFGTTGGVMEAALRTAYFILEGKNPDISSLQKYNDKGFYKDAEFTMGGTVLKIAVVSGLGNARKLIELILDKKVVYDFVEVMACPNGCVGGGGQPIHDGEDWTPIRTKIIRKCDETNPLRFSHENPAVKDVYDKYLGKPNGEKAHHLLHVDHND